MLPGGRNSGQKAQKGPEKKKFGRKNLWPNYGRISSKVAEKGPKKFFERISFFYCNDKHSETIKKNLFTILLTLRLNAVLRFMCKLAGLFPDLAELFSSTGRKKISGPGNSDVHESLVTICIARE